MLRVVGEAGAGVEEVKGEIIRGGFFPGGKVARYSGF